ncbi:MAG: hypothetical protein ACLRWP_13500 [Bilophila wadsworthia]
MMIVYDDEEMAEYFALHVSSRSRHPVLIDKFMKTPLKDVDALSDGEDVYVAGVMEHIEEAGIHSRLSCVLPPYSLPAETVAEMNARPYLAELCASAMNIVRCQGWVVFIPK